MFQASPAVAGVVVAASVAAVGVLAWAEWRRADRRRLPWRLAATVLAVLALALLGLRPTRHPDRTTPRGDGTEAALYTSTVQPAGSQPIQSTAARRFTLPGVPRSAAPPDALVLLDLATLPRRFPQVGSLLIYGDGLEPFDLPALRPLRVVFHPPEASARPANPAVSFLSCPRELPLGEPLVLQGRVDGLTPGQTATLALASPDGSATEAATAAAGPDGSAAFSVRGAAPAAVGRFEWRLRLLARDGSALPDDPLGVAVVRPALPRVLVLETTPRFDTAALRRWFEQAGGTLTARTQVGKDLYRFFGPGPGAPPREFSTVDAALLAGFDLVLADGRSLQALAQGERAALRAAVADGGLGILTLADEAVLPAPGALPPGPGKPAGEFPFPWTLLPVNAGPASEPAAPENTDRPVRPRWPGMDVKIETPVDSAPFEIAGRVLQTPLIHDDQGRTLAAAVRLGRGQLALTLLRETGRWTRANEPAAFAAYWSRLFSMVARPREAGSWSLTGGDTGPVRVDEPLELAWQGAPAAGPRTAQVADGSGERTALPLTQDAMEPDRWRTAFWPRRAGWHRVTGQSAAFDFYVAPAGAWPELAAARRRAATARFAAESRVPRGDADRVLSDAEPVPVAPGWWFGLFMVGVGTLWVERRVSAA